MGGAGAVALGRHTRSGFAVHRGAAETIRERKEERAGAEGAGSRKDRKPEGESENRSEGLGAREYRSKVPSAGERRRAHRRLPGPLIGAPALGRLQSTEHSLRSR